MTYHGWAVIRQADVTVQVYVNVSAWAEFSGWKWSGNFESAPSAPLLHSGEAVLELGDSQPAQITITSPEITSHHPVVYDGDFTGHSDPPPIIQHRDSSRLPSPHAIRSWWSRRKGINPPGRRPTVEKLDRVRFLAGRR